MIKSSSHILLLISCLTPFTFTACTSNQHVVAISDTHYYNHDFGLVPDHRADEMLHQEYLSMQQPTKIEMPIITDPEISTELVKDPDAFYAHEYVQPEPVITYKYPFDPKFYSKPEWRTMEFD